MDGVEGRDQIERVRDFDLRRVPNFEAQVGKTARIASSATLA
jgi:hypothetical protein